MKTAIRNGYYGTLERKDYDQEIFTRYGRSIKVTERIIGVESKEIWLNCEVDLGDNMKIHQMFRRDDFFSPSLSKLLKSGVDVTKSSRKVFEMLIQEQEILAPTRFIHNGLGWNKAPLGEKLCYKAFECSVTNSTYQGPLDIKPHGSLEEWVKTIGQYGMGTTSLQLSVILGLSSVLVGFFQDEMTESIVAHIFGPSSKGKTTALLTAISCGGNPNRSSGLMTQWCSTQNGIYGLLRGNNGIPFGIDELSSTNESDLSDCIYTLANGAEKHRLTREASYDVERNSTWATTIISTGEKSLLSCCNKNAGLNIRVLEINTEEITPDADTAEKLTAGVKKNYGHACSVLAHYLAAEDKNILECRLKQWQEKLSRDFAKRDEYCNRISKKLAIIMLTAELSNDIFELSFEMDAIETLLIRSTEKQNDRNPRDIFENTMQCLTSHIASHPDLYVKNCVGETFKGKSKIGIIKEYKKPLILSNGQVAYSEIIYFPEMLEKILKDSGLPDLIAALNTIKNHGLLNYESDGHLSRKRKINGVTTRVYVVHLPQQFYDSTHQQCDYSMEADNEWKSA